MMRAHCNAIPRILEHEIAAANAIHAGIADAIMILDNLRPINTGFGSAQAPVVLAGEQERPSNDYRDAESSYTRNGGMAYPTR